MLTILFLLLASTAALPSAHQALPGQHPVAASHASVLPIPVIITKTRKKKGPNHPYPSHVLVSNLHVIPIQHGHYINQNGHSSIHNLVPLHELTVIPLRRVERYEDERDRYRTPLGGYGAGWGYGGHGAGHGFHYAYG